MDSSDSMQPVTRSYVKAEKGVCKALDHTIVHLGRIGDITNDYEALDKYYCPTCNKTWEES